MAGLGAMQPMEKASDDDDIHYLLPMPPGLHPESPELFGFFTYEFRIGHGHWSDGEKENLWSTAQGRFGRPLEVAGMQHPAPTLLCNVNRDKDKVYVSAPYAKAVWKGKNVTSDPPRTQLHCVLYAQVKQADRLEYRNILLDEKLMTLVKPAAVGAVGNIHGGNLFSNTIVPKIADITKVWTVGGTDTIARANVVLSNLTLMNEVSRLEISTAYERKITKAMKDYRSGKVVKMDKDMAAGILHAFDQLKLKEPALPVVAAKFTDATLAAGAIKAIYKDLPKTATAVWDNKEIAVLLQQLGLPEDAALSVLVVEVFGNITNIFDHFFALSDEQLQALGNTSGNAKEIVTTLLDRRRRNRQALNEELGNYRILRTSPLTEVPFVCCPTCG